MWNARFTLLCATMLQMRTSVDIQDDDHKQYFAHFNPKEEKKEKRRYEKVHWTLSPEDQ